MYWANRKSEFYGTRLDSLGPIRLRLATLGLSAVDFIMERFTAGSIFNLMPEELEYQDYQLPPGPVPVWASGNGSPEGFAWQDEGEHLTTNVKIEKPI